MVKTTKKRSATLADGDMASISSKELKKGDEKQKTPMDNEDVGMGEFEDTFEDEMEDEEVLMADDDQEELEGAPMQSEWWLFDNSMSRCRYGGDGPRRTRRRGSRRATAAGSQGPSLIIDQHHSTFFPNRSTYPARNLRKVKPWTMTALPMSCITP